MDGWMINFNYSFTGLERMDILKLDEMCYLLCYICYDPGILPSLLCICEIYHCGSISFCFEEVWVGWVIE